MTNFRLHPLLRNALHAGPDTVAAECRDRSAPQRRLARQTRVARDQHRVGKACVRAGARPLGHRAELRAARIVLVESGGDNLAATFSPEQLVDAFLYVIDVAEGDKIPIVT